MQTFAQFFAELGMYSSNQLLDVTRVLMGIRFAFFLA